MGGFAWLAFFTAHTHWAHYSLLQGVTLMNSVGGIAIAEVDATGHRTAGLLLHLDLQGLGLADDCQVGAPLSWLHVLPVHVCPLASLLCDLDLSVPLLQDWRAKHWVRQHGTLLVYVQKLTQVGPLSQGTLRFSIT